MKIITLAGFQTVQSAMEVIANDKPEWFPLGYNGIHAVSNCELFAGFDPKTGAFYMSAANEMISGFSPANELVSTFENIKNRIPLTFNNEYSVETLWHEMVHGITGIAPNRYPMNKEPLQEGIVQIIARHGYQQLLMLIGAAPIFQQKIIVSGLAYPNVTGNLLHLFERSRINAIDDVFNRVQHSNVESLLKALIAERLSISSNKAGYLLNQAESKLSDDFKAKIDVQIRNAQRNKGAS